jgi:hypothetical protein
MHFGSASTEDQEKMLRLIRELLPVGCKVSNTLPGCWQESGFAAPHLNRGWRLQNRELTTETQSGFSHCAG